MLELSVLCVDDAPLEEVLFWRLISEHADFQLLLEEAGASVVDRFVFSFRAFLVCSSVLEYDVPHGLIHLLVHVFGYVGPYALPGLLPSFSLPVFASFSVG